MEDSELTRVTDRTERDGWEQAKGKSPAVIKTVGLLLLWIAFILLTKLLKVVPDFAPFSLA
jgi:hypothetical protein